VASGESEKLIEAVAERVREVLGEAERRADEIVAEAERRAQAIEAEADAKAERTVALSEDQARERVERARKALDELGVALGSGPTAAAEPEVEEPEAPSAQPVPAPEPEPEPEPEPGPDPEPEPGDEPGADSPSTDELIAQLKGGDSPAKSGGGGEGDAAARLVAMKMALDGSSREEVDGHLAEEFDLADRDALLDEVFARVG
jgi:hypothetical protein